LIINVNSSARAGAASAGTGTRGPPVSSRSTAVWYWLLNGVPTTVMFNRTTTEIWCNGYVLESVSRVLIKSLDYSLDRVTVVCRCNCSNCCLVDLLNSVQKFRIVMFVKDA